MMKVLIVGGTGGVGRNVARLLAAQPLISALVIAGRDDAAAAAVAAASGPRATGARVDVHDDGRLVALAAGVDLLVDVSGPDLETPLPVAAAAVRAGVDFLDIGADGSMTARVLALDGAARAAGVTGLIGMGVAPGVTNLLALHAARQLDEARAVRVGYVWADPRLRQAGDAARAMRASGRVNASWQTILSFTRGPVRAYRRGAPVALAPFAEARSFVLPEGVPVTAYPVDSAELRTLPSHLPGVADITSEVALFPAQLAALWRAQAARIGRGEVETAAATIAFYDAVAGDLDRWLASDTPAPTTSQWAVAEGIKDGRPARYTCWPRPWWLDTAAVVTTAALAMLRGDVPGPGFFPPEARFAPLPFIAAVADSAGGGGGGALLDESLEYLDDGSAAR